MPELTIRLKKPHPAQKHILETAKRFNVLKCGRRFGKTSLSQELLIEPALEGFPTAYYAPTYKDLSDYWKEFLVVVKDIISEKNEQLKQVRLITGGIIDFWSMEDPDSGRGRKYKRVIIDECEKAKRLEQAWKGTIRALLTDFIGDCWFLSTPKFGDTFFKKLFKEKEKFPNEWQSWVFTTYDNPYMISEEIDSAKATLDPLYFRCEYLAEDVEIGGLLFCFAFDENKHVGEAKHDHSKITYLSFDFNRNPICCSVIQHYDDTIKVVETIKLPNSDIYQLCKVIRSKYPNIGFVTGDATGQNSSAMVKDNINYYTIIRSELGLAIAQFKIPSVNPPLVDNQVLINSLFSNYNIIIDKDKASSLIFDCKTVKMLPDGSIDKSNRLDPTKQADALDTFRYWCNVFMGGFLSRKF